MSDYPAVSTETIINGVPAVTIENDALRLSVLPEVGAKIYELVWKSAGRELLWHNPRVPPQPYPVEAAMSDFWCGGWDDIFPTCDACEYGGLRYPALGELHQVRFSVDNAGIEWNNPVVRLSALTPISPIRVEKTITLKESVAHVHTEITNLATVPVDFIWGTHPAFRPSSGMILRIPAKTGIVSMSSGGQFGVPGTRYAWPNLPTAAGGVTDMSRIYGIDAKGFCGHYATDLEDGWYALENSETGEGIIVGFPVELCPHIWMWLSYGGWRGHWVVIIEPYTSYPVSLADAVRGNTHRRIETNEKFAIDIIVSVYRKPETLADALRRVRNVTRIG
jgi:hypothetical protein